MATVAGKDRNLIALTNVCGRIAKNARRCAIPAKKTGSGLRWNVVASEQEKRTAASVAPVCNAERAIFAQLKPSHEPAIAASRNVTEMFLSLAFRGLEVKRCESETYPAKQPWVG